MRATRRPASSSSWPTVRVVWLLPQPVRTAPIPITGLVLGSMVAAGPARRKSAPAAMTIEALCMTSMWATSE